MAQLILFAELTSGTESACFTVINVKTYMSICDIIMVVCNKNKDQAGRTWRDMDDCHREEARPFLSTFQFPGQGETKGPLITFESVLKLMMWLPGDMAKDYSLKACNILTRYLGCGN